MTNNLSSSVVLVRYSSFAGKELNVHDAHVIRGRLLDVI